MEQHDEPVTISFVCTWKFARHLPKSCSSVCVSRTSLPAPSPSFPLSFMLPPLSKDGLYRSLMSTVEGSFPPSLSLFFLPIAKQCREFVYTTAYISRLPIFCVQRNTNRRGLSIALAVPSRSSRCPFWTTVGQVVSPTPVSFSRGAWVGHV